jgi:exopolyphosphatase / guanosine-5'-triphosphate,3'-diphosphate pyrophosphatase
VKRVAVVDIGSNSTRLLIADVDDHGATQLERRTNVTRLGDGVDQTGRLSDDAVSRVDSVLADYRKLIDEHNVEIVIGLLTSAVRDAANGDAFLARVRDVHGIEARVLTGHEEGRLTFLGATVDRGDREHVAVVDIGGGSTEIVIADDARVTFETSLPLGSVRLTERFVRADPPAAAEIDAVTRAIDAALAPVPFAPGAGPGTAPLVGVAGTVTSLAAMAQGLTSYDPERVHGYRLGRVDLGRQIDRLRAATQAERERIAGLDPRRADVILAGALILEGVARAAGVAEIRVSDRGIRWGLAYEMLEAGPGA